MREPPKWLVFGVKDRKSGMQRGWEKQTSIIQVFMSFGDSGPGPKSKEKTLRGFKPWFRLAFLKIHSSYSKWKGGKLEAGRSTKGLF